MAKFLNIFFSGITVFFVAFVWVYYCLRESKLSLILAGAIALCASYAIYFAMQKQWAKRQRSRQAQRKIQDLTQYLRYNHDNARLFEQMLRYYQFAVERLDFDTLLAHRENKTTLARISFAEDSLSQREAIEALLYAKRQKADKLCLFCCRVDNQTRLGISAQMPTQFVDVANLLELLRRSDKLPPLPKAKERKSAYFCQYAFSKKRFGWYLSGAIFTAISATVTFFPLYTILWATVMLALALYSLLNKRYNPPPTQVTLD